MGEGDGDVLMHAGGHAVSALHALSMGEHSNTPENRPPARWFVLENRFFFFLAGHHVGASVGRGEAPWAMGKRIGGGVRLASWGRAQLGQMRELGFLEKSLVQSMANPLLIH